MEPALLAADTIYVLIFAAAGVLAALTSHKDLALAKRLVLIGALLMAARWSAWAIFSETPWLFRAIAGAIIGAALFTLVPAAIKWIDARPRENRQKDFVPVPNIPSMSNHEIKRYAQSLVAGIRILAANAGNEESRLMTQATSNALTPEAKNQAEAVYRDGMMNRMAELHVQYLRQYGAQATALFFELRKRDGLFSPPVRSIATMQLLDPNNMAGGIGVITAGATTLQQLADQLPDE